jgi:hypothetical protein
VPFYLATREFFRLARERLRPGGALAINVATVPTDHRLAEEIAGTMAHELPHVWSWQALRFNRLVVGFTAPLDRAEARRRAELAPAPVRILARMLARDMRPVAPGSDPWTDDRSPVEWVTDRMIVEWAAQGGRLEDDSLPTAPRQDP